MTDAALVLGWLDPGQPFAGNLRLERSRAEAVIRDLARRVGLSLERCAEGVVEVATATMVRALRRVSVERGLDPRQLVLVPFGGAGPMFTCRIADHLGMRKAIVPPHAGVLSALGLASAPARLEFAASLHRAAGTLSTEALDVAYRQMEREAERLLPEARHRRLADCRYPGQGYELTIAAEGDGARLAERFHEVHRARFGHADPSRAVDVVNVRLLAERDGRPVTLAATPTSASRGHARPWMGSAPEGIRSSKGRTCRALEFTCCGRWRCRWPSG